MTTRAGQSVTLEVCVDSIEGAMTAVRGGADRIELCSSLALGGLTPSYGLMKAAAALPVACMVMIRPGPGNFRFNGAEFDIMRADIDAVKYAGLSGVVLGAQAENGGLNTDMLSRLVRHADGMPCTLHRVVDVLTDPLKAVDNAIDMGFERVLTSGGCASAIDGISNIIAMHQHASGRIKIMPGSGLNTANIAQVLATGVTEVHASCSEKHLQQHCLPEPVGDQPGAECEVTKTSGQKVADLRSAIDEYVLASGDSRPAE